MTPSIIENIFSYELLRKRQLAPRPFATSTHAMNSVDLGDEPCYRFPDRDKPMDTSTQAAASEPNLV
jgi:hypothetical protein